MKKRMMKEKAMAMKSGHDFNEAEMKMGHRKMATTQKEQMPGNDGSYSPKMPMNDSQSSPVASVKNSGGGKMKKVGKGGMN